MVNNNQVFEIELVPASIREIERIVDLICDQLFINDTYYGSILMALTEMFTLLIDEGNSQPFKIEYSTDYQQLQLSIFPIDSRISKGFEDEIDISKLQEDDSHKSIFLIKSLVDSVTVIDTSIVNMGFDISALHNKVYNHRSMLLNMYFNVNQGEVKVNKQDDQL